ncbi:hypothetical protein [Sulfuriroseicoccus oceanibius]|uniref:Uncharacterized protein n=1 Tax=Sulfuriroseicoccus oceanibius TaxID=2707525 RepID=A0A6B3LCU0_9BACT|nr:hypothetical protein [Sulfuriroseicoccus oceanibius]QQL44798.1 hypothetical protein G3M56_013095 [Sulfuriroseicoccus oceanibius]
MFENIDWASFSTGAGFGLIVGLLIASICWLRGIVVARGLRKQKETEMTTLRGEIDRMQEHLHTQMRINAKGNEKLEAEVDDLRKQNENLRIENSSLRQKPGHKEIRQLEVYDRAVQKMNARAPGFAPAWQSALAEAETEQHNAEGGVAGFVRRIFRGGGSAADSGATIPTLEMSDDQEADSSKSDKDRAKEQSK